MLGFSLHCLCCISASTAQSDYLLCVAFALGAWAGCVCGMLLLHNTLLWGDLASRGWGLSAPRVTTPTAQPLGPPFALRLTAGLGTVYMFPHDVRGPAQAQGAHIVLKHSKPRSMGTVQPD